MMDMVGIELEEKADCFGFTVGSSSSLVFNEKLSTFLKLMLCQFFDGSVAPPVFLLSDRSIPSDWVVKVCVPLLSPYPMAGAVGHVWLCNRSGDGMETFYRNYIVDIVLPAFEAQRKCYPNLDKNSIALCLSDGEQHQLAAATSEYVEKKCDEACVSMGKLNAGLSFNNSACDAGRTHQIIHTFAKKVKGSRGSDSLWRADPHLYKFLVKELAKARIGIARFEFSFSLRHSLLCSDSDPRNVAKHLQAIAAFKPICRKHLRSQMSCRVF
jgi:hypothetical protein